MKICCIALLLSASLAWSQAPASAAAAIKPDTVVATVNGKSYTAADLDRMLALRSPVQRQMAMREPQTFLEQMAMFELFVQMAEKEKIDERTPYKEQIAESRRQILVTAAINEYKNAIPILPAQQKEYYETNLGKYKEAKVKVILIGFGTTPGVAGKKPLTEAEAKVKADAVIKLARSGVDFTKLVKEHSEDPGTAGNNGDLGIAIRSNTSNVPENIRTAVLLMKPGDVTEAIRQPNGFYIVRVESSSTAAYEAVKDDIFNEMKDAELRKLIDETKKKANFKVENGAYFNQSGAAK